MFVEYNPNPKTKRTNDCVVRAVAKALDTDWDSAYIEVVSQGLLCSDMPMNNPVWGELLKQKGYKRYIVPNTCPDCYTVQDFCKDHPKGTYVLGTGTHAVTVVDGDYFDAWDSGDQIPLYYYH